MKAALIYHNWNTAETKTQQFGCDDPDKNPILSAEELHNGIKDDWPESEGWISTVIGDEEAKEKMGKWRTNQLLGILEEDSSE